MSLALNDFFTIMTFRYEDLALDPYDTMQKAYDFVGLETTGEMREWLRINTMVRWVEAIL